ncbi:MAG: ferrous iron transport protein B [Candidatus Muiribacteriota bacterium]
MENLKIALAGNPNVGKTCVFNYLTGSNQHVGNWPGVTVEKKEGYFKKEGINVEIVDLPGIYSFSPNSLDEKISRDFLIEENPDGVVLVVDATNLERNLFLLVQVLELKKKAILVLNMMDEVRKSKINIDTKELSKILNIPVIESVAFKGEGISLLKDEILKFNEREEPEFKIDYGERIDGAVNKFASFLEVQFPKYDKRWLSIKALESDPDVMAMIENNPYRNQILEELENTRKEIGKYGDELDTFFIERKFGYVSGLTKECVKKSLDLKVRLDITDKIDSVLTNRLLGIPLFLFLMYFLFQFVFIAGDPMHEWIGGIVEFISHYAGLFFKSVGLPEIIVSLITDGIIEGVGAVLSFIPFIALLYISIGILEDSGYMARAAFVMDKLMHLLGLHGKSFIPMVVGFGCTVPGVMATRTLESKKDRILTMLVLPFMSCGAKLPIYALFAAAFFPESAGNIVFAMYAIGIFVAVIMARILKTFFFQGEISPLIMELPPYRIPLLKNLMWKVYYRCSLFIKKAGTVILVGVIVIWFLGTFPLSADTLEETYLARAGKVISPVFAPAGFGTWQASVALTTGVVAKEIVVGTFGTIFGIDGVEEGEVNLSLASRIREAGIFNNVSAFGFIVFSLLYVPCFAAVGAIKKEAGMSWALFTAGYTTFVAWVAAVLIYQIGSLFF